MTLSFNIHKNHMAAPIKITAPEFFGTFRFLPPEISPIYTGTLRNLPQPSKTFQNPNPSGNLPNLPELASGTYTNARRNLPELSGNCFRSLYQRRNPPAILRNSPEPTSQNSSNSRNLSPKPAPTIRTNTNQG